MRIPALLVPLAVAAAIAGCGSNKSEIKVAKAPSGSIPRAKAPVSEFEKRTLAVQASIQAGKCGPVNAYNKRTGFGFVCSRSAKDAYKGFKFVGRELFGTGAVVEFTDAQIKKARNARIAPGAATAGKRKVGALSLALDSTGRYQATGPVSPILPGSVIGTKPASWSGADATAVAFLKAIRDDDCATWLKLKLMSPGVTAKAACKQELERGYAELHRQLTTGQKASLFRLGGDSVFYFYGLRTGNQFRTLTVYKTPSGRPPYVSFGTFRATQ